VCESRYGTERLEPGQTIHHLSSWQKFYNSVFLYETREFVVVEDMIHSVDSANWQHLKYSIIVSLI